jgi:hypothetical protein
MGWPLSLLGRYLETGEHRLLSKHPPFDNSPHCCRSRKNNTGNTISSTTRPASPILSQSILQDISGADRAGSTLHHRTNPSSMDVPYPSPTLPTTAPCYPRGQGGHFPPTDHPTGLNSHPTHPMPDWALPPPSPSQIPTQPPVPSTSSPPQLSTSDFRPSTILQRQNQERSNRITHEGTPPPPPSFPPWAPNFAPTPPTSKRINPHPPQLPKLVPAYPIVLEPQPQLEHGSTHPHAHAGGSFIGSTRPLQRDALALSPHCRFPFKPEVEPVIPPQPSPGLSFTTTPPASLRRPDPLSVEEARLNAQVGGFMALVDAREEGGRADHEEVVTEIHQSGEVRKKERREKERREKEKGIRGRVKKFFRGE